MGLDFSHCNARWSYSGFNSFRTKLAAEIGIDLRAMDGFQDFGKTAGISWDTVNDPIKPLLHHSDCDGDMSPEECKQVAPRLLELIANWESDWTGGYNYRHGTELARGMMEAAKLNEPLEFR